MNKNFVFTTLAMTCAALAQAQAPAAGTAPAPAPQQQKPTVPTIPGKIAIIQIQAAILNTKEGQAASGALQAKFNPKRTEFDRRNTELVTLNDQLKKSASTMSDEGKVRLEREIDSKKKLLDRDMQDANEDMDQELGKIMQEFGNKMVNVIMNQYCAQNGYSVVLDASNDQTKPLWWAPSTDITADIVRLYDQAYPPGAPKAAAAAKGPASLPPAGAAKPPVTPPGTIKK